jgi:RNA polymerase sigma factor (sigma-70 family)
MMKGPRGCRSVPADLRLFCDREYRPLVELLSLYCGRVDVAEEFAHEALIRLCRDWHKVRRMDHPGAWLKRVGINVANSHFRRRGAERRANERLQGRPNGDHHEPDPASAIAIREAVSSLPKRQKAVLVLHFYGDLTYAQVADHMNCPENTVKSLARRALKTLRERGGLAEIQEVSNA